MNTHKSARLAFVRRQEMVRDMDEQGMLPAAAAAAHGVTAPTTLPAGIVERFDVPRVRA
jgi:hypothetical protein